VATVAQGVQGLVAGNRFSVYRAIRTLKSCSLTFAVLVWKAREFINRWRMK